MLRAITHTLSPQMSACELTFISRETIDLARAQAQHQAYCQTLEKWGVTVETLTGNADYPDACFVEDTAVVLDELAILCCPGAASRRPETPLIARALAPWREVLPITLPATLDGGDVLRVGKTLLVGESTRTNSLGIQTLAELIRPYGYRVIPLIPRGSLHLKTVCTALDDETLILSPDSLDTTNLAGFRLIETAAGEAAAANVLRVGETICVQAGCPETLARIQALGYTCEVIDTSELAKAEGALTCLSLIFETRT